MWILINVPWFVSDYHAELDSLEDSKFRNNKELLFDTNNAIWGLLNNKNYHSDMLADFLISQ